MGAWTAAAAGALAPAGSIANVEGPLKGYHRDTYVVRPEGRVAPRFKVSEPRPGVFWYDLRCCGSEEELIAALGAYVRGIPQLMPIGDKVSAQIFIEGRTLGAITKTGGSVGWSYRNQIERLFRSLARFDADILERQRICNHGGIADKHDSTGFLRRLLAYTLKEVYWPHRANYGPLLQSLGVPDDALVRFGAELPELTRRPYQLLHGDLHRENFIVDRVGRLWTIDWELAQVGDPLYDLATHLHLMRYPLKQERDMIRRWHRAVESVHPGASLAAEEDLPVYLAYKRIQSAYTDIIRGAASLGPDPDEGMIQRAAAAVERVLVAAQEPLHMEKTPPVVAIEATLAEWHSNHKWATVAA